MRRSDLGKAAILVTVLAVLLPVAAAHGADWQTRVNDYPIQCTVSDIGTAPFQGASFRVTYTFCDRNSWSFSCQWMGESPQLQFFRCGYESNVAFAQTCNGAAYKGGTASLKLPGAMSGTAKDKYDACDRIFGQLGVTVTPLK
jgi:hypothetical protein